jgi:ariadne-1
VNYYSKYITWHCKQMVDSYKNMKWCPQKNCEYIIERPLYSSQSTVDCKCGFKFCFYCLNEDHMPASCEQAKAWNDRITGDTDNLLWIKANTKACPNCKTFIEKNQGCNSVRCSNCKETFCWMCMKLEKDHGSYTHIF